MRTCFLCGQNNFKLKFSLPGKNIFECQNDQLFIGQNQKNISPAYNQRYYQNDPHPKSLYRPYFEKKIALIQQLTKEEKPTILDVGCGWGQFLETLKEKKISYLGIDTSNEAIKVCLSKKLNCQQADIISLAKNQPAKYSVITGFQLLEHLANPLPLLASIKKLLKKNGLILLTTPNNNSPLRKLFGRYWSVYNTPSHLVFYNQSTLKKVLMRAGFKNIQITIDSWRWMSLGYILSRLHLPFLKKLTLPIPTDPFGDLLAIGYKI